MSFPDARGVVRRTRMYGEMFFRSLTGTRCQHGYTGIRVAIISPSVSMDMQESALTWVGLKH